MAASKAQQAATAERRAKAIQMRLAGADWQMIADRLEYAGKAAACKDVTRALKANQQAAADASEDLRTLELARLDRLQAALWTGALAGDHKVVDTILRIMQRRAKYTGLDEADRLNSSDIDRWLDSMLGGAP